MSNDDIVFLMLLLDIHSTIILDDRRVDNHGKFG